MALAARSFTDPEGLQNSALAYREIPGGRGVPGFREIFVSSRRGVFPTKSSIVMMV
jgi:hypothetical protein